MKYIKNYKKRLKEVMAKVLELPIEEIIRTRMNTRGRVLCPFHDDKHAGNFAISRHKGIFKCFSCGATGNSIKFISMFDGVSYTAAALKIAVEFEIISKEEYEELSNGKKFEGETKKLEGARKDEQNKEAPKQSSEILNYVYSLFAKGNSLKSSNLPKLSQEHREYLHNRGIGDDEIKKYGYFTIPTNEIMSSLCQRVKSRGFKPEEVLLGVPGFCYHTAIKKVIFSARDGIGIPIKDYKGNIVGIQIRKDNINDKEQRYTWFSSSFVYEADNKYLDQGCSPGSPIDVVYPNKIKNNHIFITEGHFKAAVIAKELGCVALSVQGVGNFKGIENTLKPILKKYKGDKVIIAYDADMIHNEGVKNHAGKLADLCQEKTRASVYAAVWNEEDGKGIDDLINNGKKDTLKILKIREARGKQ